MKTPSGCEETSRTRFGAKNSVNANNVYAIKYGAGV